MNIKRTGKNHWVLKSISVLFAFALTAFNFSDIMLGLRSVPSAYYAETEAELIGSLSSVSLPAGLTVSAGSSSDETLGGSLRIEYRLFGLLPVRSASAFVGKRAYLAPCGQPVGVSIYTRGVLVVGLGSFENERGARVSPAADCGLRAEDVILSACGVEVSSASDLQSVIDCNPGGVELSVARQGKTLTLRVAPQLSSEAGGAYRIGAWIRDSTVGIGTLSFYDPETDVIAALGHAVVDADTGALLSVKQGRLVEAEILGVTKGAQGSPGELHGSFDGESRVVGTVCGNSELGIYGYAADGMDEYFSAQPLAVAFPGEVHTGAAVLIASVDSGGAKPYSCRIIKTGVQNEPAQKGLVILVDDPALIEKTGGIVQGMSGSPIIQDGRLVGVVTHVFVNDPLKGYGAYAYWMYKTLGGQPPDTH